MPSVVDSVVQMVWGEPVLIALRINRQLLYELRTAKAGVGQPLRGPKRQL
jgi:hypothetical protein